MAELVTDDKTHRYEAMRTLLDLMAPGTIVEVADGASAYYELMYVLYSVLEADLRAVLRVPPRL